MSTGPHRARALIASALALFGLPARAQEAAVVSGHSTAVPDPAVPQPALEAWALPLESRTEILEHVGRDTPGVLLEEGGLAIEGSRPRETQLFLDGVRVSRLRAPVAMLQGVQVVRAGYGATLADVTGGAVGAATRLAPGRWTATADLFRDWRDFPDAHDRALSAVAAGPIIKDRVQLLIAAQTEQETFDPRVYGVGILPMTQEVETRDHRGGMRLAIVPGAGQRLELLAVGSFARRDNTTSPGYTSEAQPRWEERYGLIAARWRGVIGTRWRYGAHLGLEGTDTRELPRLCLTRPDCDQQVSSRVLTPAGPLVFGNFDHRSQQDERGLDAAAWLQLALPPRASWRSSLRLGSRLQAGTVERELVIPGNRVDAYVFGGGGALIPDSRTIYFANDPRSALPEMGPLRSRFETIQALQSLEWPMQLFERLYVQPGVGLISARGSGRGDRPAASAWTQHLAASFQANRAHGIWLRATTSRRADGDLNPLLESTAVDPVSQRCRYSAISGGFDTDCVIRGGAVASIGLPCGPSGVDETGAPCRQALSLPRSREHTLGASGELFAGLRLDLDAVYRRTEASWERVETNRIWSVIGQDARFLGFRNGRPDEVLDVSTPGGAGRRHWSLTTSLLVPTRRVALTMAHSYAHTRSALHPLRGLELTADDHGRHFVHLQAIWNLWGHGSLAGRYRYLQGVPLVPLFFNPVLGTWERYRTGSPPGGGVGPGERGRLPSTKELSLQLRLSLRRFTGVDAQAYLDAIDILPSDEPREVEQRVGTLFGTFTGVAPQRWYRLGLQAGF